MIPQQLAKEWELSPQYAEAFDEREGLACARCGLNLRLMGLASAMLRAYRFRLPLVAWVVLNPHRRVLEINGSALSTYLKRLPRRTLASYPEVSIEQMPFPDSSFDLVVHTETLEHVDDPIRGLMECRRVLKPGGWMIYTVPAVLTRMTRTRDGLPPSYHGSPGSNDFLVRREYGADFWTEPVEAGFYEVRIVMLKVPAVFGVIAR